MVEQQIIPENLLLKRMILRNKSFKDA